MIYHLGQLAYIVFIVVLFFCQLWFGFSAYIPLFFALFPITYEALQDLKKGRISTDFFLVIAAIIGILGHEEKAITLVLVIMLFAHYIEEVIKEHTEDALESLVKLIPSDVLVRENGKELLVPIEKVRPGSEVIIKTGGRIPVDGIIIEGMASIQEAVLTGESIPLEKDVGQLVFAGTYIEGGSIVIEAQKVGKNTFFGKISALLEQAGKSKARVVLLTDRIASVFTVSFLVFITLVWFITYNPRIVITLLIFGSPLELSLVTPLTLLSAIVAAFRHGILIKSSSSVEALASTDTMIFDKTGTLTLGSPTIVAIESLHKEYTPRDILFLAAIAEKKSGHILAKAVLDHAKKEGLTIPDPDTYLSVTGHGVSVTYQGTTYLLGHRHFVPLPAAYEEKPGYTALYLATDKEVIGVLLLADEIKPEARETIIALKKGGIKSIILLSGDKQEIAQSVAQQLGITEAYGEVLPDEKLAMLHKLQSAGTCVTMIGDGINDAPALRQAYVGIAMGGMGMEPAIQAADMVLMSDDLKQIVFLYDLSKAAMKTVRQNLIIGFALTHTVGILLALAQLLTPFQAVLFHAVPDILILLNAARLMRFGQKKRGSKSLS